MARTLLRKKIQGIGVDAVAISRFRKLDRKKNASFYKKIFTPSEAKYCERSADPARSFATRFAAKEAIIKAIGKKFKDWTDIEITMKAGRPAVTLKPAQSFKLWRVDVSLTHEKNMAMAFAVARQRQS